MRFFWRGTTKSMLIEYINIFFLDSTFHSGGFHTPMKGVAQRRSYRQFLLSSLFMSCVCMSGFSCFKVKLTVIFWHSFCGASLYLSLVAWKIWYFLFTFLSYTNYNCIYKVGIFLFLICLWLYCTKARFVGG